MTLLEFTDLCGVDLIVYHTPNAVSKWICHIGDSYREVHFKENLDDVCLSTCTGWGDTMDAAIFDLRKNLKKEKIMVIDPVPGKSSGERIKFNLPEGFTGV